ncbi:DUF2059 domain-containing protein [Thalassobius vesicularis]|uniref:DUF2059 domain-containing protein n=1 Tax=Thalassobius vesicularis TaxID=1294297 RepID=A0A4S3MAY1_9RHOB|nr:DUF2059 domain-containing protein [Thalassobius vesicularis]THD75019.1 DUF2059 domain-containing protein [Thalassobius vesicularis]
MRRVLVYVVIAVFGAGIAIAEGREDTRRLIGLLRLSDVIHVMRQEGLIFGAELGQGMLPEADSAQWAARVSDLYDTGKMEQVVEAGFSEVLQNVDQAKIIAFYDTDLGRRIVSGEITAREAFLDKPTEDAARARVSHRTANARLTQIGQFIEINDLVEYNVAGALNANYMFYRGLTQGGMIQMSDAEILAEAWAEEDATREDSISWLYAYLDEAYAELSVEELKTLTDFAATPEGQALNRALFQGFDRMYAQLSLGLGLAIASLGQYEEL